MASDHTRRTADAPWRRWYWTQRWRRLARAQLEHQPLCERHLRGELIEPATVVHHVVAHRGDETLFWAGPFESLCKACHDGEARREERGRGPQVIDAEGWPVDPTPGGWSKVRGP